MWCVQKTKFFKYSRCCCILSGLNLLEHINISGVKWGIGLCCPKRFLYSEDIIWKEIKHNQLEYFINQKRYSYRNKSLRNCSCWAPVSKTTTPMRVSPGFLNPSYLVDHLSLRNWRLKAETIQLFIPLIMKPKYFSTLSVKQDFLKFCIINQTFTFLLGIFK